MENDPLLLQDVIWKSIGLLPDLRHLRIRSSVHWKPIPEFDPLNSLESINIVSNSISRDLILLSKIYASSSNLTSITFDNFESMYSVKSPETHGLQQLFSSPRRNLALPLRYLSLSDVPVCLDDISSSHFTHLTSFKLPSLSYENSPADIWIAFRRSNIRLEELEVGFNAMADSLNDYLSSFTGLKKLSLTITGLHGGTSSNASANKFWSSGFPNHVNTIQDFSLRADYGGQWCFGLHNHSLLEKCTKLRQFTVSLRPEDIPTKEYDFNGIVCILLSSTCLNDPMRPFRALFLTWWSHTC